MWKSSRQTFFQGISEDLFILFNVDKGSSCQLMNAAHYESYSGNAKSVSQEVGQDRRRPGRNQRPLVKQWYIQFAAQGTTNGCYAFSCTYVNVAWALEQDNFTPTDPGMCWQSVEVGQICAPMHIQLFRQPGFFARSQGQQRGVDEEGLVSCSTIQLTAAAIGWYGCAAEHWWWVQQNLQARSEERGSFSSKMASGLFLGRDRTQPLSFPLLATYVSGWKRGG